MKNIGSTCSASIWGLLWRNPKGFLILTTFRGCTSHFRFDLFYIVDFHSALTLSGKVRAECKTTMYKRSKQKWLVHPLKVVKVKNPFGFLQSSPQILAGQVEPIFVITNMFSWNTLLSRVDLSPWEWEKRQSESELGGSHIQFSISRFLKIENSLFCVWFIETLRPSVPLYRHLAQISPNPYMQLHVWSCE